MRWTLLQISEPMLAALGTGLDPMARVAGVSIDSRTLRAGELFFAIHGPRHDGHDHVAAAFERGALAAVVAESRGRELAEALRTRCLVADDTLRALHRLATAVRLAWGKKIMRRCWRWACRGDMSCRNWPRLPNLMWES